VVINIAMPTVFILLGFRFYFFSNDHTPIHIHISKGGSEAKFNVVPDVLLISNQGFKNAELKIIKTIIEENKEVIIEHWITYFNNK